MDKARRIEGRVERDPFATMLAPCPVERLRRWPVSPAANATRHDGPDLMAPVASPQPEQPPAYPRASAVLRGLIGNGAPCRPPCRSGNCRRMIQ